MPLAHIGADGSGAGQEHGVEARSFDLQRVLAAAGERIELGPLQLLPVPPDPTAAALVLEARIHLIGDAELIEDGPEADQ
jgi:hypothetical protein